MIIDDSPLTRTGVASPELALRPNAAEREPPMALEASAPVLPITVPAYGGHGDSHGYDGFSPSDAILVSSQGDRAFERGITSDVIREGQDNIKATIESRYVIGRQVSDLACQSARQVAESTAAILLTTKEENQKTRDLIHANQDALLLAELNAMKFDKALKEAVASALAASAP